MCIIASEKHLVYTDTQNYNSAIPTTPAAAATAAPTTPAPAVGAAARALLLVEVGDGEGTLTLASVAKIDARALLAEKIRFCSAVAWAKMSDAKGWVETRAARVVSAAGLPSSTAEIAAATLEESAGARVGADLPSTKLDSSMSKAVPGLKVS